MVKQTKKERNITRYLAKIKAKEKKEKRKKSLQYLKMFRDIKRVFNDDDIRYNILKQEFPDVNVFSKRRKSKEKKNVKKGNISQKKQHCEKQ